MILEWIFIAAVMKHFLDKRMRRLTAMQYTQIARETNYPLPIRGKK